MNLNHSTSQIRYQNVRLLQITTAYFEYSAIQKSNKREVVLKIQNSMNSNVLQEETAKLIQVQDVEGIPEVIDYDIFGDLNFRSFFQLDYENKWIIIIKNVLLIGIQLIKLLQKLHDKKFILSNIIPCNFCFGAELEDKLIYLKDLTFLQSKECNIKLLQFPFKECNFISPVLNIHKGPSQIDDLYSLAYLLIYLINGTLPWQQIDQLISEKQFQELQKYKLKVTFDQQFWINNHLFWRMVQVYKYVKIKLTSKLQLFKNILISKIYENGWKLNDQIEYKNEQAIHSSKSIVSIKSRSRGTSITKTPNQRMIETLSPILEVDKEFELAQSAQKQNEELFIFKSFRTQENQQKINNRLKITQVLLQLDRMNVRCGRNWRNQKTYQGQFI